MRSNTGKIVVNTSFACAIISRLILVHLHSDQRAKTRQLLQPPDTNAGVAAS